MTRNDAKTKPVIARLENFSWQCPYCNQHTTITSTNYCITDNQFNEGNKDGDLCLTNQFTVCPNINCREYTIEAILYPCAKQVTSPYGDYIWKKDTDNKLASWKLKPQSMAKPLPDYIPKAIRDDYQEACLIMDLSPKASATLSRRCLQGMIRDFFSIQKNTLYLEIKEIEEKVSRAVFDMIDAIRNMGNIGAHMEKDINLIIDIEPDEAHLLIGLIEILIKEWYINRYEREQKTKKVIALVDQKKQLKSELEKEKTI